MQRSGLLVRDKLRHMRWAKLGALLLALHGGTVACGGMSAQDAGGPDGGLLGALPSGGGSEFVVCVANLPE